MRLAWIIVSSILSSLVWGGNASNVQATHIAGMDVRYACIGPNIYRVYVYWYHDCTSFIPNPSPTDPPIYITNPWCGSNTPGGPCAGTCPAPTQITPWTGQVSVFGDVTPLCDTAVSNCTDPASTIRGIWQAMWYADFDFSNSSCPYWSVSFEQFARNPGISTITNSGGVGLSVGIGIDRTLSPCNNSPIFTSPPVPFMCVGQLFTVNQGAVDPDGDSLTYEFGPCRDDLQNIVPYTGGFTPDSFMASSTPINMDTTTGDFSLTPIAATNGIACIYVKEWRNQVLINTTVRDMQLNAINCINNIPEITGVDSTGEFIFRSCDSLNIDFFIYAAELDPGDSVTWFWDVSQVPGLVVTVIDPGGGTLPYLHVTGQPLPPRPQPYTFLVTAQDDACPLNGIFQRTFQILVGGGDAFVGDFVSVNCNTATLSAAVYGTIGPYDYTWTGPEGLTQNPNADQATVVHTYDTIGVFPYTITVIDGYNCINTDSGTVSIAVDGLDTTLAFSSNIVCQYDTLVAAYAGVDLGSILNWNFGPGATPTTATGVGPHKVVYISPGVKPITLFQEHNGCVYNHYRQITVPNRPLVTTGSDISICSNEPAVSLNAQVDIAGPGCSYLWAPSVGLSATNVLSPVALPAGTTSYTFTANCGGCTSLPDTVVVSIQPTPTADFLNADLFYCLGQGPVQINGLAAGGQAPYAFQWVGNTVGLSLPYGPNPLANPSNDTTYYMVVTDAFGCSDTDSVQITVVPPPTVSVAFTDTFRCAADAPMQLLSQAAGGSGSYSYQWAPNYGLSDTVSQNPFAFPPTSVSYSVWVYDLLTGCYSDPAVSDSSNITTVIVNPSPIAEAGSDALICKGDSAQVGGFPSGGAAPQYQYSWFPPIGLSSTTVQRPMASPPTTQRYYLRVRTGDCWSTADSVLVAVQDRPTVAVQDNLEACSSTSVKLVATVGGVIGNPTWTYQWTPSFGLSDPTVLEPFANPGVTTTYTLVAFANGCASWNTDTVMVQVRPQPFVDADTTSQHVGVTTCGGVGVELPSVVALPPSADPSTPILVQWSPQAGLSDPSAIRPIANPAQTTTYYLMAQAGTGGSICFAYDSITVFVNPFMNAVASLSDSIICEGDSVTLTGEGGIGNASFTWDVLGAPLSNITGASALSVPDSAGVYMYVLTVEEGNCFASDSAALTVLPAPTSGFSFTARPACEQQTVNFASAAVSVDLWIWNFGDGSPTVNQQNPAHTYTQPGVYTVTLETVNASGCASATTSQQVVFVGGIGNADYLAAPTVGSTLYLPNANVQLAAAYPGAESYVWQFGDGQAGTGQSVSHDYQAAGAYTVKLMVTDTLGCVTLNDAFGFLVKEPDIAESQLNVFTPNNDGVNDRWNPQFAGIQGDVTITVMDRWGNQVYRAVNHPQGWDGKLPNGDFAPEGVYIYIIEFNDRILKGNLTLLR